MIDFTARQLRGFLLVADFQSFTRAADALFITPSGLSLAAQRIHVGWRGVGVCEFTALLLRGWAKKVSSHGGVCAMRLNVMVNEQGCPESPR